MTPTEIIETYGLTDKSINRALHHVQPETVAAYADTLEAFSSDELLVETGASRSCGHGRPQLKRQAEQSTKTKGVYGQSFFN